MKVAKALVLLLPFLVGSCGSESGPELEVVWQDEFDGPEGQLPDPANWRFDVGTGSGGWGNAQLEYDTDRAENVSLDGNGHLRIVAREESYLGSAYTSGRINTRGTFARTHGRFEARIKLPTGQGIWPAFWLLGADFESVGWPDCGEIDIMEFRGQEPNLVHGSIHGPGYSGGDAVTGRFDLGINLPSDFHVFAVEWTPDRITWIIDDVRYQTVTPADLPPGGRWVFERPFFVILNVAVGGHFVGPPNGTTSFPQTMLVDYVRVYGSG